MRSKGLFGGMFASTSFAAMAEVASPKWGVASPVHAGAKRRSHPRNTASPTSGFTRRSNAGAGTGLGPVNASCAAGSTPVHSSKSVKTESTNALTQSLEHAGTGTGTSYFNPTGGHSRSKSLDHLDSPLLTRRALPSMSLSVGAADDATLQGRAGIVYINGTNKPQDGWYQRVRPLKVPLLVGFFSHDRRLPT